MKCPICGSDSKTIIEGCKDNLYHLTDDEFSVEFCDSCKIGFSTPVMSAEELSAMYPVEYEAYVNRKNIMDLLQVLKYMQDIKVIRKYLKTNNHEIKKIFEFGSGRGQFLFTLSKEFDGECTGVEMSKSGCSAAKKLYGIDLYNVSAQNYKFKEKNDLVVMRHVLEHIDEFNDVLKSIYDEGLSEGGVLFLKLPCFNSYEVEKFGKDWKSLDLPRHRVHFTDAGINKALKQIGYKNIEIIREVIPTDYDESLQIRKRGRVYKRGGVARIIRCAVYQLFLLTKKQQAGRMMVIAQK
ncbi:MAG: class I SAM-dependent methyltransferase [Lachnospiraceae bacterium]|nr:class I SAM-dependent methyltransferase [Lachnospiraceae bacterium]